VLNRYERLKAGEPLDKLLEEAEAEAKNRNINPKTSSRLSFPFCFLNCLK
jgi:hypothetical protein